MTTKNSPLRVLKAQADKIAKTLKAVERGEVVVSDTGARISAARNRPSVVFGIAMDDKFLRTEMTWAEIRKMSEAGISEWLLKHMKESRDAVH